MLDGGPSRLAQAAAGRRAAYRSEPARHQPEAQPQPPVEKAAEPEKAPQRRRSATRQSDGSLWFRWVVISLLVVLVGIAGWWVYSQQQNVGFLIEEDKFQAVFFASGQVYFGRLEIINDDYIKLREVFYIQSNDTTANGDAQGENPQSSAEANMRLIKLGDEVHAPKDAMIINRDQVLFFENLEPDGRVSQLIQDYKSNNRQ